MHACDRARESSAARLRLAPSNASIRATHSPFLKVSFPSPPNLSYAHPISFSLTHSTPPIPTLSNEWEAARWARATGLMLVMICTVGLQYTYAILSVSLLRSDRHFPNLRADAQAPGECVRSRQHAHQACSAGRPSPLGTATFMLAYLRSPTFLALALLAFVGTYARPRLQVNHGTSLCATAWSWGLDNHCPSGYYCPYRHAKSA